HSLGLYFGAPRRSMLGAAPYAMAEWQPILLYSTLGLTLLFISATLYFVNIFGTVLFGKKIDSDEIVVPIAEPLDPKPVPKWLDTWWPWVNGAIFLLLLSYGPMLYQLFRDSQWLWPGRVVW
ncbi:MAG: cytochrome C oxidase subunit I, partial [Caldilineaceae bacterium]|nr:cytochrome C oxidase subunit I [Caldilineaceae bacterium]